MFTRLANLPADPVAGLKPQLLGRHELPAALALCTALTTRTADTRKIDSRIQYWLYVAEATREPRGVMTLRNPHNVVVALFLFAVCGASQPAGSLQVPLLRVVEPSGRPAAMHAVLRTVVVMGERLCCGEARLRADTAADVWAETVAVLRRIGRAYGFVPCGADWVRPFRRSAQES